jgi:hypothetical protein
MISQAAILHHSDTPLLLSLDRQGTTRLQWRMSFAGRIIFARMSIALTMFAIAVPGVMRAGRQETAEISKAIQNTRKDNNFRITASIRGPNAEVPMEADFYGRNFQLTTQEGVIRRVDGDYWVTRDLGKTWTPMEGETWILNIILTPIHEDENSDFEFVGVVEQDGKMLRHYRLHVPDDDKTDKDELPQFWLVKGDKDDWYVWRARTPVMVKEGSFPTIDVRVSEIGKIPPIKIPKGMSPSIPKQLLPPK